MLIQSFLCSHVVESFLNESCADMLMVTNLLQVLSIESKRMLVVRIDLTKHCPKFVYFFSSDIDLFAEFVQNVKIWHECC